jgi:glycosyltransferase involved in cell wall biosynthesis
VEALQALRDDGIRIPLVVAGPKGWLYEGFFRRLEELDVRDSVQFTGYVPAGDLPAMYSASTFAVTASVYEGAGLPVLEAMACGVPVICSGTSSLPEMGGDAPRYFDPYDVQAMAEAIRVVWNDVGLRTEMSEKGLDQAALFSWERAAEETWAVYEKILPHGLAR